MSDLMTYNHSYTTVVHRSTTIIIKYLLFYFHFSLKINYSKKLNCEMQRLGTPNKFEIQRGFVMISLEQNDAKTKHGG